MWTEEGQLLREYAPQSNAVSALAWHPTVNRLAVASYGGINIWDGAHLEPVRRFRWKGSIVTMRWSPDSRYIATSDQDSTVHFWIVKTGRDLQMWGYPRKVRELSWDRHTVALLASADEDGEVFYWRPAGNLKPLARTGLSESISHMSWSPDDRLMALGSGSGELAVASIG